MLEIPVNNISLPPGLAMVVRTDNRVQVQNADIGIFPGSLGKRFNDYGISWRLALRTALTE